jgi:predicted translin family RNA/ssDNA-binding protein
MAAKDFLKNLKVAHETFAAARREIIGLAGLAQNASKRAIFAVQREDDAGAKALLAEAEDALEAIRERAKKNARLAHEGSYRAALEEYAEARFVAQLAWKGEVSAIEGLDEETQIGGLCDAAGEVVRLMVRAATEGRDKETRELKARLDRLMEGLDAMDYSGYLRTKYDQARSHYRKAEDILYDLSLKR